MTQSYVKAFEACLIVKAYLNNLEDGTAPGHPLRKIRQQYHAPLHAALDAALKEAEDNGVAELLGLLKEARQFIAEYPEWAPCPPRIGHVDLLRDIDAAIAKAEGSL